MRASFAAPGAKQARPGRCTTRIAMWGWSSRFAPRIAMLPVPELSVAMLTAAALLATAPPPAASQTVVGRLVERGTDRPIEGGVVSVLSPDRKELRQALSDSTGRFVLALSDPGEFYLKAVRLGYRDTRSPLLALRTRGTTTVDLEMRPEPIGLEGFEVSVKKEAVRELSILGLTPGQLGNRWVDRRTIEAVAIKRDIGTVLEWNSIAGIKILRPEDLQPGSDDLGLCVSLARARTGGGAGRCALGVLNGIPVAGQVLLGLDPEAVESMAVLLPIEATLFYGGLAGGGALLVWTRAGR